MVLHWFTGNNKELEECIEREWYFSINENMIKSNKGKEIINNMPLSRIFIESDFPFNNEKNKYNLDFAEKIINYLAKTRNKNIQEINCQLRENMKTILS